MIRKRFSPSNVRFLAQSAFPKGVNDLVPGVASVAGTVPFHKRHALLVQPFPTRSKWPKRFEEGGDFRLFHEYERRLAMSPTYDKFPVLLGVTDPAHGKNNVIPYDRRLREASFSSSGLGGMHSLVVFPECVAITGIRDVDIAGVSFALGADSDLKEAVTSLAPKVTVEELPGLHMVMCLHYSKEASCVDCGMPLIHAAFNSLVSSRGPKVASRYAKSPSEAKTTPYSQVPVALWSSTCLEGCQLAANIALYPTGDWIAQQYHPQDMELLLQTFASQSEEQPNEKEQPLPKSFEEGAPSSWFQPVQPSMEKVLETFPHFWRGRTGLTKQEQRDAAIPVLQRINDKHNF